MHFLSTLAFGVACAMQASAQFVIYEANLNPGGAITRFESTLVVPNNSPSGSGSNVAEISELLVSGDGQHILRNVVTNQNGPNNWMQYAQYVPDPVKNLASASLIYAGQAITSLFTKDIIQNLWQDSWVVTNGGAKPPHNSVSGSVPFNPSTDPAHPIGDFTSAFLTLDLRGTAKWDFGSVSWYNVIVQAFTTETAWCTGGPQITGAVNYVYTTPVATNGGDGTVTCYIQKLSMISAKPS